jgi:hypothetical protein
MIQNAGCPKPYIGVTLVGYNCSRKFETMLPYICNDVRKQIRNYKKRRISVHRSEETSKH